MASTSLTFDILARDKASSTFKHVGDSASKSTHHIAQFGAVLKKTALGVGALTAATGIFVVKAGVGYVDSLNKIQALSGANDKTMAGVAKRLEANAGLYAKMGQSTGDAANGVVELVKAGQSLSDAMKSVQGTMILAKAGELSVADASNVTANALNTFHLKASKAGDVANYLANAANISSADVVDLAESLKYVSPVAASAGVSIQQTNAILAELANAGIKGSSAGTAFRTFLLSLQAPSAQASGVLKDLGVNVYDATGKMKPLGDVIQIVAGKLDGLSQKEKTADLKAIFGKVGIAGATTILKQGADGLKTYTKGVEKAGAAQKLAEAKSKGLAGSFAIVAAGAKSGAQSIYRQFSPLADKVIRPLATKFSTFAGNLGPDIRKGTAKVKGVLDKLNISGVGKGLAKQAQSWAAPVIDGFKQGLDSGDWSGLGKALGSGMVKALGAIGSLAGKIGDTLKGIDWVGLGITVGKYAVPFFVGFAAGLLNFDVGALFSGVMKHWADVLLGLLAIALPEGKVALKIAELLDRIPFAGKLLAWGFKALNKFSRGLFGKVFDALKFMGRAFLAGFREVFPKAGAKFAEHLALFPLRVQLMGLKLAEKGLKMVRGLGSAIVKGTGFVVSRIGKLIGLILRPWADTGSWLVKKGVDLLVGLARGIGSTMGRVLAPLKSLAGRAVSAVGDLGSTLWNAGVSLIKGFLGGIGSMFGAVKGKLGELTGKLTSWKGPPEKDRELLRPAGRSIMDGLLAGFADRQLMVKAALGRVTDLISKMGDKISKLQGVRSGFMGTFTSDSVFGADLSHTATDTLGNDVTTPGTAGDALAYQKQQAAHAKQLLRDVNRVTKMGLSKALVRQLEAQGASGEATLHALAAGTPGQIKQLNRLNKQTSASLRSAGLRAGNYVRGGSIDDDIRRARRQDHVLELLEHHLKDLAESQKKGETIIVKIGDEAIIKAVRRYEHRKGKSSSL